jgi:hypothetical protein
MRLLRSFCFVTACLFAAPALAQAAPLPFDLQAGLSGKWTGSLGYRDYQSNKLFELAIKTDIQALPDKATVIRVTAFDDGPKVGLVYITSASLYDAAKSTVATTTLRKGRAVEISTETATTVTYTDLTHWVVRYEEDGTDDDKPAMLRTTETRDGNMVKTVKEVMAKAEAAKGWQFRNQTRLTRIAN